MKRQFSAFIIEDNGVNRLSLETILEENGYLIVGSFTNAEEAWISLRNIKTDIVLIDINLAGEKDGVWLASKINEQLKIPFIYLTAYGDDATIQKVEKTKPSGYLMKPYNKPTLLTTIKIAIENFDRNRTASNQTIFIKDSFLRVKLDLNKICFIQSEGNYLTIHLKTKKHIIRSKLNIFLAQLPQELFVQTHRRFVINISKITMIGNGFVEIGPSEIPVTKTFIKSLEEKLKIL